MIPDPSIVPAFVAHVCLGLVIAFVLLARWGNALTVKRSILLFVLTGLASAAIGLLTAPNPNGFSKLLAWSWTLAVVLPATAFAIAVRANPRRGLQASFLAIGLLGVAGAVYAFVYEPRNLEVTHHEVVSDRVDSPLRIAVVADLQTDAPGDHERAALQAVMDAKPDLIVFVGDVIQHHDPHAYADAWATLRGLAKPIRLDAPLGVFLVEGDSEYPHDDAWIPHAEAMGLEVWPRETTSRQLRDDVTLTGFGLRASAYSKLEVERPNESLHVVFGHRPAFALGEVDADLLLAGHTHGGQVQLPGWGPLLTLSKVPRRWAWGRTELPSGATLFVSRGVGMERAAAPRIRFWCRPEVMIVDVVPPA
jgi:predicted MPP superfamily phosphohydrolase